MQFAAVVHAVIDTLGFDLQRPHAACGGHGGDWIHERSKSKRVVASDFGRGLVGPAHLFISVSSQSTAILEKLQQQHG